MDESTTIQLKKSMPIDQRIEEVNRRISEWIETLDKPFNHETDEFQLVSFESGTKQYRYQYAIARGVKSLKKKK